MTTIGKPAAKVIETARSNRDASGAYWLTTKDVATLVRDRLRREFPGIKFSVRSKRYTGGSSVSAYWTDGPLEADVRPILNEYSFSDFDGMIDMASGIDNWLLVDGSMTVAKRQGTTGSAGCIPSDATDCPEPGAVLVKGGADHVFGQRELSEERKVSLAAEVIGKYMGEEVCVPMGERGDIDYQFKVTTSSHGDFEYLGQAIHRYENGIL
jgi:hypothetical protein